MSALSEEALQKASQAMRDAACPPGGLKTLQQLCIEVIAAEVPLQDWNNTMALSFPRVLFERVDNQWYLLFIKEIYKQTRHPDAYRVLQGQEF